jgi:hypothetical protein
VDKLGSGFIQDLSMAVLFWHAERRQWLNRLRGANTRAIHKRQVPPVSPDDERALSRKEGLLKLGPMQSPWRTAGRSLPKGFTGRVRGNAQGKLAHIPTASAP